jgi:hypothetical protein
MWVSVIKMQISSNGYVIRHCKKLVCIKILPMKIVLITIAACITYCTHAQSTKTPKRLLIGLPVVHQPDNINPTDWFLALKKPPTCVRITENQTFVLHGVYKTSLADTAMIGAGTVTVIGKNIIDAFVKTPSKEPQIGNLAFLLVDGLKERKDAFFKLARYAIELTTVTDSMLYTIDDALINWNDAKTTAVTKAIVNDIVFTSKSIVEQTDNQEQKIPNGKYKGQSLFATMQKITAADVNEFLEYVQNHTYLYWGKKWKTSEVFATWLVR